MIDHVNIPVSDLRTASLFYQTVLATLGMGVLYQDEEVTGFGRDTWILGLEQGDVTPLHLALVAQNTAEVDAFHAAGLNAGGTDNGAPGLRPQYGAHYYAGFLRDPDGHNIEAVFRGA